MHQQPGNIIAPLGGLQCGASHDRRRTDFIGILRRHRLHHRGPHGLAHHHQPLRRKMKLLDDLLLPGKNSFHHPAVWLPKTLVVRQRIPRHQRLFSRRNPDREDRKPQPPTKKTLPDPFAPFLDGGNRKRRIENDVLCTPQRIPLPVHGYFVKNLKLPLLPVPLERHSD